MSTSQSHAILRQESVVTSKLNAIIKPRRVWNSNANHSTTESQGLHQKISNKEITGPSTITPTE